MIPKIWKVLDSDELRPQMNHCLVTKEDVVASNSKVMVIHRTIDIFSENFIERMPKDGMFLNLLTMKELAKRTVSSVDLTLDKKYIRIQHIQNVKRNPNHWVVELPVFYDVYRSKQYKGKSPIEQYPNYRSVVPDLKELVGTPNQIAFNPNLLADLAEAMGCMNAVQLRFQEGVSGSIFVKIRNEDYQPVGVIMPALIKYDD